MTDHSILRFYSPFFKSQCFIKRWVESLKYGTISSLWDSVKFNEPQLAEYDLHKACTVSYLGTKVIPVDAPMVMPIAKVENNVTVWFLVDPKSEDNADEVTNTNKTGGKNAFDVLMSKKTKTITAKELVNSKKDELYNDLVSLKGLLTVDTEETTNVKKLFTFLADALWAIDGNHSKINTGHSSGHCLALPSYFDEIYQKTYFDWQKRKRARPTLCADKLILCSNNLYDIISMWSHSKFPDENLLNASRALAECLRSYSDYLKKSQERMEKNRCVTKQITEKFSMPSPISAVPFTDLQKPYQKLDAYFRNVEFYTPIYLENTIEDFGIPDDRKLRYTWFKDIKISYR